MIRALICLLAAALMLVSCQSPAPKVTVTPGASIAGRELVVFEFGNAWLANHSIVQVLYQEMARRGLAVKLQLLPGEAMPAKALILRLENAGEQEEPGKGRIDFLRHLSFALKDASGQVLAQASYSGKDLDRLEQRQMVKQIADQLFAGH